MALGFEKMFKGSLKYFFEDRESPYKDFVDKDIQMRGQSQIPMAVRLYGNAGVEHMEKYGSTPKHFAKIGYKNHKHSVNNPYSQFRDEYSLSDIENSRLIHHPLTLLQCSPTSDGAACAILCSEKFMLEHGL
jgi:sterol carrier protein 2